MRFKPEIGLVARAVEEALLGKGAADSIYWEEKSVRRWSGFGARGPFREGGHRGGVALKRGNRSWSTQRCEPEDLHLWVSDPESGPPRDRVGARFVESHGAESIADEAGRSWIAALLRSAGPDVRASWTAASQSIVHGGPQRTVAECRVGATVELTHPSGLSESEVVADPDDFDPEVALRLSERFAERVDGQADPKPGPTGEVEVVFAPGVGGVLIHELVGHALEADSFQHGRSWIARAGGLSRPVAAPGIEVIDDPRRARLAARFDDEGEPTRPVRLVRDGVACALLHDRASAEAAGAQPTGSGRRASYREPVQPRMSCTFLAPGSTTPESVLGSVDDGIYLRKLELANTDPVQGVAWFRATDSSRIRNGKIAEALLPSVLFAQAADTLSRIEAVADDLAFDRCTGLCVRRGQALITSVGGPTFRTYLTRVSG